jgi:capsular exopolysaccharide synthesis family protein
MNNPQPIFTSPNTFIDEEEIDLRELFYNFILNYWYLYLIGMLIGGVVAYLHLQRTVPVFEIKSKILIKEQDNQSFSPEEMVLDNLSLFGTSENVANEIQILKSNSLMNKVVNQLGLATFYNWKYYLKTIPMYQESPVLADSVQLSQATLFSNAYRLGGGISFELNPVDFQHFDLIYNEEILGRYQFGQLIKNDLGSFRFNLNDPQNLINDSILQITFKDPELVAESFQKNLGISLVDKQATMLELRLEDVHPHRGIQLLNTLVTNYNEGTVEDKNQIAQNTLEFINDRLGNLAKELSSVEGSVENYKRKNDITTEVASNLEIVMTELSKYTDEQTDLEVQLSILQSMSSLLGNSPTQFDLIPANLIISNTSISGLIEPYNELVLKRQLLLETAKPNNPLVIANTQQLTSLRATVRSTIQNLTKDLTKKLNSVKSLTDQLAVRLKKVPTQERGLLEIKRQQVIKENLYLYLLQKREETALSLIATEANSKIIDLPKSSRTSIKPKKAIVLLGGLFSGLFLPFFFVVGRNLLKNSIETEEDLKALTKVPLLGTINKNKDKKSPTIVVHNNSRTAISERFRLIRTNLTFTSKKKTQTILVTSSVSGEGKTFTAINLAMSFALTRKKTILLELDFRKPKLKKYLKTASSDIGITNYLVGNKPLSELINVHPENPNFHYIQSGPIPHNPNELLAEKATLTLFQELKKDYDIIIIDTPPAGLVSDAFLLNEFISDSIYVVRAGITKKIMLEGLDEIKKLEKLKGLSILLNGVDVTSGYGYRRYGYGGGYGYFEN